MLGLGPTPTVAGNDFENLGNLCTNAISLKRLGRVVCEPRQLACRLFLLVYKGSKLDLLNWIQGVVGLKVDCPCGLPLLSCTLGSKVTARVALLAGAIFLWSNFDPLMGDGKARWPESKRK